MKALTRVLASARSLQQLQQRLTEQERLLIRVRECLPVPADRHCIAVVRQRERLLLFADSSAWASRLRYLSRRLMQQLAGQKLNFRRVEIRVSLPESLHGAGARPPRRARRLTKENAEILRCLALSLDHADLQQTLLRLSRHTGSGEGLD